MRVSMLSLALMSGFAAAASAPVSVEVTGLTLRGTLETPDTPAPWPTVLIVAGSGPTDRNGNSAGLPGANNSLQELAQGLANLGIASVRYDKRGVGQSLPPAGTSLKEEDLVFGDFVNDAAAWLRQLKADPRVRALGLVGHSEGALIALAAAQAGDVAAVVTLAGPGENLADVLARQVGANPANPPQLRAEVDRILAELRAGRRVNEVMPVLAPLFRPSVQPFLISAFRYEPAGLIKSLPAPVMIVQGTSDLQVTPEDARRLAQARPEAELLLVPGMNHVLKQVGEDTALNQRSYVDASVPLSPDLLAPIATFLKAHLSKPSTP